MKPIEYKYERYEDRSFPVYASVQKNRKLLVNTCFHEEMEFMKVVSGRVLVQIGTQEYTFSGNDIIFLPPFTSHGAVALSEDACVQGLVFHPSVVKQPVCCTLKLGSCRVFGWEDVHYAELDAILERCMAAYWGKRPTYKLELTAHLMLALGVLIRCGVVNGGEESTAGTRIQPALDYIAEHYDSPIRLRDLSSLLFVCDDHLIRLFKAATLKTPAEYITDFRIAQALKLLSSEQDSIVQIAEKLCFANPSHFSKVFREKMNVTPSQYRKQHREGLL